MKKLIVILFVFFISFYCFSQKISGITTTLIIIEEQENDTFVNDSTPFTDGIFNAMWEKEFIFFDMKIDKPIKVVSGMLEIQSYVNDARGAGADSILLIKFNYKTKKEGAGIRLSATEALYNLYSLNTMKSLRNGKIKLNISEYIENNDKKNAFLKNTGNDILNDIYK
ncbi:MAG: hypothetical protein A2086_10430 [Spirochaetes bacterium GWD1_27_9]|nr:MAG: hypothetical protein A2Z98_16225 [Spirochaetes bacterium GWB1_27_13]OHD22909.1 MAG: hypothetical protein A2Y34_00725 [Spirochaetes bacterium GWC1_27_15]OHD43142.1 MAG: hypothetical protein A2086_10430 [Spirochaetes bacterium GWD1_27_9]